MADRRRFLQSLSSLPLVGGFFGGAALGTAKSVSDYAKRDIFGELGVRPFINAAGTYTMLTSSLMPPEVMAAMQTASRKFVHLNKIQDAVGAKIAQMLECEAAMVTSGCAAALTCGTAAILTGKDAKLIRQIPDLTGLKSEVIVQKKHRNGYDHAVRLCGLKMVEIETVEDFERAVNEKTAMTFFANFAEPEGQIKGEEWIKLSKKHNLPSLADCSADTPPPDRLFKYTKMGFDLVGFSGGKGICGPQSAGMLLGRKDLIEAAKLNTSPNSDSIGRGMKVNKEEIVGMLVALELFLKRDHAADRREYDKRIKLIQDSLSGIPSVTFEVEVPPIANNVPHLRIKWDQDKVKISPPDVKQKLLDGEPSIEANPSTNKQQLSIGVWMMQPGEAQVVAKRIREILKSAS